MIHYKTTYSALQWYSVSLTCVCVCVCACMRACVFLLQEACQCIATVQIVKSCAHAESHAVVGFAVMLSTPRVLYSTSVCPSQKTPLMVTAFKGPSLCGKQSAALRLGGTWRELLAWSPRPSYSCSYEQAIARFSACLQSVLVRQSALQHLCLDDL